MQLIRIKYVNLLAYLLFFGYLNLFPKLAVCLPRLLRTLRIFLNKPRQELRTINLLTQHLHPPFLE